MAIANTTWRYDWTNNNTLIDGRVVSYPHLMEFLEDETDTLGLSHRIVSSAVTLLVFISGVIEVFLISKTESFQSNRTFLYSLALSDVLQVRRLRI